MPLAMQADSQLLLLNFFGDKMSRCDQLRGLAPFQLNGRSKAVRGFGLADAPWHRRTGAISEATGRRGGMCQMPASRRRLPAIPCRTEGRQCNRTHLKFWGFCLDKSSDLVGERREATCLRQRR